MPDDSGKPQRLTGHGWMGRQPETDMEALAMRLHHALDEVLALFGAHGEKLSYGEYSVLDEALDALKESANKLDRSLTISIAEVIRAKYGYVWDAERAGKEE